MAIIDVKVPQLSESVSEATLLNWKKQAGEAVSQDEILIEIETDKVVLEVPAPASGVLAEILVADGGTVAAQQTIARINTEAQVTAATTPTTASETTPVATEDKTQKMEQAGKIAMPSAAKLLAESKLSVEQVSGTGRGERITKGDVLAALDKPQQAVTVTASKNLQSMASSIDAVGLSTNRPEQRVPMTRLRARIAERLLQSQASNAILTTFNEVNMQPVMDLRNRYKDKFEKEHGVKLGFMSFFVKAAVHALRKYPIINASVDGNDIVYHGYFDIGIAVGSPRGLVVPILRDVDQMSIADIERKIAEFGVKAKDGKLSLEELTGGTFSISNGGVFGSMLSTPIINPPQSAILGVHATKERPVVENGQIVIRPINYLALSYDHRIIDGREAVLSLVTMKEALEDPARLLLDI